jgi:hypothetical protein
LCTIVLVHEPQVQYLDLVGPALPATSPELDPGILRPTALGLPPRCAHRPAGPDPTQGAGSVAMSERRVARDGELTSGSVMLDTLPSVI